MPSFRQSHKPRDLVGRATARPAFLSTRKTIAGPIFASPHVRPHPISTFRLNPRPSNFAALIKVFARTLNQVERKGYDANVFPLMQRILDIDALHPRLRAGSLPATFTAIKARERILLIDERARSLADASLSPRRRRSLFRAMVLAAAHAHPNAEFWLARSGAPGSGKWLSGQSGSLPINPQRLSDEWCLRDALHHVDHVYVVDAPEGMAAIIAGIRVHIFGKPYYAGWGLSDDHLSMPDRTERPSVATLFQVAFLCLSSYIDPQTHEHGTLQQTLDCIALQHDIAERFAELRQITGVRFQWWKRPLVTPYLLAGGGTLRWTRAPRAVRTYECAALWGARSAEDLPTGARHVRIEDGFIHSLGLGSDMSEPRSQVIDTRGMYFDASRPSDLSVLLNEAIFNEQELARAAALRDSIIQGGLTKYNLGRRTPEWLPPADKQVVLVTGQVANDASIRLGAPIITTAEALLREVRSRRPNAFIVYKPHPDVMSGNRAGLLEANDLADVVDIDADVISLIEAADEVHTLSSLAGFDALLRGKPVFTYGMPFYAGWGLTNDALAPLPWRERELTLDMLTAGVLIRYPIYWDWQLSLYTTPEAVVKQLTPQASRTLRPVQRGYRRALLKAQRWTVNVIRHLCWRVAQ